MSTEKKQTIEESTILTISQDLTKVNTLEATNNPASKKPYVTPKLTHEGKWDTVTMNFGGSFAP